jgi:hypothetical protein
MTTCPQCPGKTYLGDSVYAEFDGHCIVLTTENGLPADPSNKIYMEPQVLVALERYLKRILDHGRAADPDYSDES